MPRFLQLRTGKGRRKARFPSQKKDIDRTKRERKEVWEYRERAKKEEPSGGLSITWCAFEISSARKERGLPLGRPRGSTVYQRRGGHGARFQLEDLKVTTCPNVVIENLHDKGFVDQEKSWDKLMVDAGKGLSRKVAEGKGEDLGEVYG